MFASCGGSLIHNFVERRDVTSRIAIDMERFHRSSPIEPSSARFLVPMSSRRSANTLLYYLLSIDEMISLESVLLGAVDVDILAEVEMKCPRGCVWPGRRFGLLGSGSPVCGFSV